MTKNIFEIATNKHIRFTTSRGDVTTEDLWDIPLSSIDGFNLDAIALDLYTAVNKTAAHKSFVAKTSSPADIITQLKFDVVQHIIDSKIERANRVQLRKLRNDKRNQIANIIADKKDDKLKGTSLAKLEAMLDDLDDDLEDE